MHRVGAFRRGASPHPTRSRAERGPGSLRGRRRALKACVDRSLKLHVAIHRGYEFATRAVFLARSTAPLCVGCRRGA